MIYRDLYYPGDDMEQARQIGMPIDLGAVSAAANACAQKEDLMIFAGNPKPVMKAWLRQKVLLK